MKILVTGFAPFGTETRNPSWEAVRCLPDSIQAVNEETICITTAELPVVYDRCAQVLKQHLEADHYDAVLCVGQAGTRTAITPEFIAVNCKDARIADNDGQLCQGDKIHEDGPAGYLSTLPVRQMVADMVAEGIPASLSYSAGAYVCNNIMYHVLAMAEKADNAFLAGFVHIPFDEVQAAEHAAKGGTVPYMPLAAVIKGLETCIRTIAAKVQEKNS